MLPLDFNPRRPTDYIFHIFLPLLAVILPLIILLLDLPVAPLITTSEERLFTLFGFCMWCVLMVAAFREIKARPGLSLEGAVVLLLPLLTSFLFLVLIIEYAGRSFDYEVYEHAYQAVALGKNPYKGSFYFYPPFFAQMMASIYETGAALREFGIVGGRLFVFYIHQCLQFFLCNLAYQLSSRLASRLGFPELRSRLIVTSLFLFNFPLIRTLHLEQVNLYILNFILIALLALRRFPFLSGGAVMLGGLIKLYPLVMGVPLLLMKKWKALFGALITGTVVIFLQTDFGRDFRLWRQFLQFLKAFPVERESSEWIRNTTFLSLARNLTRFTELPESMITPLYILGASVVLIWIAIRFLQRERTYASLPSGYNAETYRIHGNLLDFSSLALLVTPTAWDHHYIIALPLALWTIALRRKDRPGWVGVATACIFVLPPFDVFPFSYLRMFGVIALLILASPSIQPELEGNNDPILT